MSPIRVEELECGWRIVQWGNEIVRSDISLEAEYEIRDYLARLEV